MVRDRDETKKAEEAEEVGASRYGFMKFGDAHVQMGFV